MTSGCGNVRFCIEAKLICLFKSLVKLIFPVCNSVMFLFHLAIILSSQLTCTHTGIIRSSIFTCPYICLEDISYHLSVVPPLHEKGCSILVFLILPAYMGFTLNSFILVPYKVCHPLKAISSELLKQIYIFFLFSFL